MSKPFFNERFTTEEKVVLMIGNSKRIKIKKKKNDYYIFYIVF